MSNGKKEINADYYSARSRSLIQACAISTGARQRALLFLIVIINVVCNVYFDLVFRNGASGAFFFCWQMLSRFGRYTYVRQCVAYALPLIPGVGRLIVGPPKSRNNKFGFLRKRFLIETLISVAYGGALLKREWSIQVTRKVLRVIIRVSGYLMSDVSFQCLLNTISMPLECHFEVISMPFQCKSIAISALFHCNFNVFECHFNIMSMAFQCHFNALSMSFQYHFNSISMSFQCHFSAISVLFQSHLNAISMPFPCHLDDMWMPFGCHLNAI